MWYSDRKIKKIVVFRALYLGDMLCFIPALRALRHSFPNSKISLISLPWAAVLAERYPQYVDEIIFFPGYEGLSELVPDKLAFVSFMQEMRNRHFDLALQMQGDGTIVNPLVRSFNAFYTAGFYNAYCPDQDLDLFMKYPEGISEIERHLKLLDFLHIPRKELFLEFPIEEEDRNKLSRLNLPIVKERYVCVHPGSRSACRRWHPRHFALVADYVASQGFTVVLTGTEGEHFITREVEEYMRYRAINLAGKTDLGTLAALIKDASVLLSNCTGVSHLAAALRTPSVIISMDGEPERWSPLNKNLHHVHDWKEEPSFSKVFDEVVRIIENKNSITHIKN